MLRTGKKYIDDLRTNQPTVYYGWKVVEDVASHPAFANSVRTTAEYYDLQKSSKSLYGYNSIVGGDTPISLIQPKNKSDLIKIRKGMQKVQEHFGGYFERSPDYFNILTMLFAAHADNYFGVSFGPKCAENCRSIYFESATLDLSYTHGVVSPIYDRHTKPSEWKDPYTQVGVVREEKEGVVVKGSVMVTTAGPCAERIWYLPSIKFDSDPKYSIFFSIPTNTLGVKFISRRGFHPKEGMGKFEYPISSRFDESDAMLIFDNVLIPWERIILYKKPNLMRAFKEETVKYRAWYNWHSLIQTHSKLKFFAGLAITVAESLGVEKFLNVQEKIGEILSYLSINEAGFIAAEEKGDRIDGLYRPNSHFVLATANFNMRAIPKVYEILRSLGGSSTIPIPASIKDFENPEERKYIDNYLSTKTFDSVNRIKLFNIFWDVIGSESGVRYEQFDRFNRGDPTLRTAQNFTEVFRDNVQTYKKIVRDIMDSMPNPRS